MRIIQIGIVGFVLALITAAQTDRGIITGTVQDPAKAVVPGVSVSAKNMETGALYPTTTTATGNFTITALPAGIYEISVEAPGFRKYIGQALRYRSPRPSGSTSFCRSDRRRSR